MLFILYILNNKKKQNMKKIFFILALATLASCTSPKEITNNNIEKSILGDINIYEEAMKDALVAFPPTDSLITINTLNK